VKVGDHVLFMETRKISKTVAAVVIENKSVTQSKDKKLDKKQVKEEKAEMPEPEPTEEATEEDE